MARLVVRNRKGQEASGNLTNRKEYERDGRSRVGLFSDGFEPSAWSSR